MSERLVIKIENVPLVSTNVAYRPTYKGKKAFYRRSSEMLVFQKYFSEQLSKYAENAKAFIDLQKGSISYLGLSVKIILILPRTMYFYKRKSDDLRPHDTSNYIKAIEDQLSRLLGIDDKYNVTVMATKCFDDNLEMPSVVLIIEALDFYNRDSSTVLDFYNISQ